jgi:anaerobic magnesium-protoporphyrin IX monomethyl ester cyclase
MRSGPQAVAADIPILLIRPPNVLPVTTYLAQQGVLPLGMAYLAGALRSAGYQVRCIDAIGEKPKVFRPFGDGGLLTNGLTAGEIIERIPDDAKIVAISCMYSNEWIYVKTMIKELKAERPEIVLVTGGEHITSDYQNILIENNEIDCCCTGEGEETIVQLVTALEKQTDLNDVPGIAFRDQGEIRVTKPRPRIGDIDGIAWPDWSGIPVNNYLNLEMGNDTQGKRSMPILASRGCPFQCTFCTSPSMWTTKWSVRNVDDVIDEIRSYVATYRVNHIEFFDLTAIVDKEWIIAFCNRLIKEKFGITWSLPTGSRIEALTEEVLFLLRKSGCEKMSLSPESGSKKTLARIRKPQDLAKMLRVMRICHKTGLIVKANILFGLPGQTKTEVLASLIFIFKMALVGVDDVACFHFVPYAGSQLFQELVDSGKIARNEHYDLFLSRQVYSDVGEMVSWSDHISDRALRFYVIGGMLWFYLVSFLCRPYRAFRVVFNLCRNRPITMLEMLLDNLIRKSFMGKKARA